MRKNVSFKHSFQHHDSECKILSYTCVFSNTPRSIETTHHSPIAENDSNQMSCKKVANKYLKSMRHAKIVACAMHSIPNMQTKTQSKQI